MIRHPRSATLGLVLGSAAVPAALVAATARVEVYPEEIVHFAAVGFTALVTTAAAALLTAAGARLRDGRAVLFGVAFSTMAALLAVHGLAPRTCSSDRTG